MRSAILSLFLLLGAGMAQAAVSLPGDGWTKLAVADDYVIYSHTSSGATRDIADRLMTFHNALSLVTRFKIEAPEPVTVIVFGSYTEMLPYAQTAMGRKGDVGAMTFRDGDGDIILLNGDQWLHSVGHEVYHELTHSFTFHGNATLPLWFIEGIAEFYSTFDVVRGQVKIGVPPQNHLDWLRARGLKPLANILAVDRKSPEYQGGSWSKDFYSESWLLVHYLLLGNPERGKAASQFLTLLAANQPPERACQLAFGITIADLERELLRYLGQASLSMLRYTIDASNKTPIGVPAPVGREEVTYAIGNLLARNSNSREQGKAFLEEAMKINDHRAETLADLAVLAEAGGKLGDGDALFEKAVALGNGSATVYRQYGRSLIDRQRAHLDAAQVAKARALYEKAVALNPKAAEAHIGLGITYLLASGDVHPGIRELEKGLELDPENTSATMNLVMLLVRAGERQRAEEIIDKKIAPFADAETLKQARALLEKK